MEKISEGIVILGLLFVILYTYKTIKRESNMILKFSFGLFSIILLIPLMIFYCDLFNIPTKFGWNVSDNTKQWLGNYFTEIIAVIIGASFTIFITIHEIRENSKNDRKNNNEILRAENLPLFKLGLENKMLALKDKSPTVLKTNIDDNKGIIQSIYLQLKNIGLNTARNISIIINSDILKKEYVLKLNDQMLLEKDEEVVKEFLLTLLLNSNYTFNIRIYYQDLLLNNYEQECTLKYYLSSFNTNNEYQYTYEFDRKNERQIEEYPKLIYNEQNE